MKGEFLLKLRFLRNFTSGVIKNELRSKFRMGIRNVVIDLGLIKSCGVEKAERVVSRETHRVLSLL